MPGRGDGKVFQRPQKLIEELAVRLILIPPDKDILFASLSALDKAAVIFYAYGNIIVCKRLEKD